ncbi:MAG: dihydropteroate synthase [Gemmatimonadetes bacterium]|uniref:Dihydropteroate synthase n=1 Tax=Candidatus Kutchimonas denitrificans TaxID=3056748 RepID=A0AAE5CBF0_9BACT|nr:dihydropteroate synthase [Gemmatimonadota bacterium]NIR74508.1 dihydropteroate synthase [Candidatus Kutchimonas denitrificans]NIS02698.1 dihydropteroate synthase [Gemmatimonadota bacterium]NIT68859.1 dihydropteroate synthase [Gemmatimonadota bacterium]NIU52164.1 dihydropteroate synthase [Gemmatimonadota bacterium]
MARTAAREGNPHSLPAVDRRYWRTARRTIDLEKPVLMGILNVTPDSFSDGGRFFDRDSALRQADALVEGGADIVDVGGESTRPGSAPVDVDEELRRVLPVIEAAVDRVDVPISIDTTKAAVAQAALDAGAEIVNDISGLRFDPQLASVVAEAGAGLVVMHIRGQPRTMQQDTHYDDLVGEVMAGLRESTSRAIAAGCEADGVVIDPGIGFGKTAEGNVILLNSLDRFQELGFPILVGPSRKSFIGKILDLDVGERVEATIAACVVSFMRGARIFRVHDVQPTRRALDMASAIARWGSGAESD